MLTLVLFMRQSNITEGNTQTVGVCKENEAIKY